MEILIIILGLILDRITKIWASKSLKPIDEKVIIKDIFSFSYLENRGAAFGIFQNRVMILAVITSIVILAMVYYLIKFKPSSKVLRISIALIISGAIGNLIDRFSYKFVVDFILLHYKDVYYYPTFNIADMLVVIGTILLAICIIKDEK
ncbi:signal peptidase II [Clostridium sp. SYSU_GA19001]|uniref:signal peptidase II n=1 Tax=Clostridium caldaquaticum TaxID=2940653 RepID=UPI0020774D7C|nr:signal peptidase II [Clostridium caldaquaticum]MCM8711019.1 signal peptidase II [Clostridium caldaquaticum]